MGLAATAPYWNLETAYTAVRRRPWLEYFLLFQIVCQLALIAGPFAQFRVLFRSSAFGASLAMLLFLPQSRRRHPAAALGGIVIAIYAISLLHPGMNTLTAGTAQVLLNLAILGPLFWVMRLEVDSTSLRRLLTIFWGFHACSAALGVIQTWYPGFLQPDISSVYAGRGADYLESLMIHTASGALTWRPMGLTDVPGGAAMSGFYAILFGIGMALTTSRVWVRAVVLASMLLGLAVLLMSQVRSVLLMLCCCVLVLAVILAKRGDWAKSILLVVMLIWTAALGSLIALAIGGESVTSRLATLTEGSPAEVYQKNRGRFLAATVTEHLPRYPLGAGLGQWGMTNRYFGHNSAADRAAMWVEIQWTGWLFDGGIPLILAYLAALYVAIRASWKIAISHSVSRAIWIWGAILVAYGVGVAAITFNYPIFIGQGGMEFWLLQAALFAAAHSEYRRRVARREAEAIRGTQ